MTPYYQDDSCTIYLGDCRDVLPYVQADAVITDPPYGTKAYASDTDVMTPDLLKQLVAIGTCAVFGWPERLVGLCVGAGLEPDEWVTWWPTNAAIKAAPSEGLMRETEAIAVFGPGAWRLLKQARTAALYLTERATGTGKGFGHGDSAQRHTGDVWTDAAPGLAYNARLRQHPNEKPMGVLHRLVQAIPGETILDPFMGSGTTLRAAKDAGRKAIGIEVEEKFCEVAVKRLAQEALAI